MKKSILSLAAGLLIAASAMAANPTTVLDVKATVADQTALNEAGWADKGQTQNYAVVDQTIVFNPYILYQSISKQTWANYDGKGSSNKDYTVPEGTVFQGKEYWGFPATDDAGKEVKALLNLKPDRTQRYHISNCAGVQVLVLNEKGDLFVKAYEITDGAVATEAVASVTNAKGSGASTSQLTLDAAKTYQIEVSVAADNIYFLELAFTAPAAGGSTALENVAAEVKATKVIENGQLIIIRDGVRYNALGAQL